VTSYYVNKLGGTRLRRCYEIAPPRAQQYLESEIEHLLDLLSPTDHVLELGCGYGRVALRIAAVAEKVVGIDVSEESLSLARQSTGLSARAQFLLMDARHLRLDDEEFDVVVCVQNGVCAFGVDQAQMLREAWRVLRPGGWLLLSTYCDGFWRDRLAWFEAQAAEGLLGAIDREASRDGTIVCVDGFRAGRATSAEFHEFGAMFGVPAIVREVDGSSLWCELHKPGPYPL
jgi:2-polyprenyl-6-hydroxyphenyl methylase/3-demethylubiquinone-9 3-methyltransferase